MRVGDAVRSRGARMIERLIAIDPGADMGWALYYRGALADCGLGDGWLKQDAVDDLVIECPQVYPGSKKRVDPNDLIKLARGVGRVEERAMLRGIRVHIVLPHAWKGSVPKDVFAGRIIGHMRPEEAAILGAIKVSNSKLHNVIDAVGLGLWKLGRL
jgi:hypothetical protein